MALESVSKRHIPWDISGLHDFVANISLSLTGKVLSIYMFYKIINFIQIFKITGFELSKAAYFIIHTWYAN